MKFIRTKRGLLLCALLLTVVIGLVWRSRQPGAMEQRIARYRAAGLPTTLTELEASYPAVPDAENAAIPLLEAIGAWRKGTDTNLPTITHRANYPPRGKAWPVPMLNAARMELATNAGALGQIHAALERPRSRYPIQQRADVDNFGLPHLELLAQAVEQLDLEVRYAVEMEDAERATRALLAVQRTAGTLEAEPLYESYWYRTSLIRTAEKATEVSLSRTQFTEDQLARLQAGFGFVEASDHLGRAIAGERALTLASSRRSLRELILNYPDPPYHCLEHLQAAFMRLYDLFGLTQRDIEYTLDRLDELARVAARPRAIAPAHQRQLEAKLQELYGWRSILHPLAQSRSWELRRLLPTELSRLATLRCTQTAIAIERWRLAHTGSLPPSLEALVPQYLNAVPKDPMDDKPLRFRPLTQGYVVYSVGEDGIDNGGKERVFGPGPPAAWDYTFTVAP